MNYVLSDSGIESISEGHRESEQHAANTDKRGSGNDGNLRRNGSVVGNLVGGNSTGRLVAGSSSIRAAVSGSRVVARVGGRGHDSGEGGESTRLLSSSVLRGLTSVVVDDGDNGNSGRVNSGRGDEGAGDELRAGNNGGDVLGDGDEVDGGLRSSRGSGRSRSIAVRTRAVTALNRSLVTRGRVLGTLVTAGALVRSVAALLGGVGGVGGLARLVRALSGCVGDSSSSGRADSGTLNDSLGNNLLSVRGRAVDDRSSTRGNGVDVSLTDSAGDHARSIGGLSDTGSGSRGDLSVRARAGSGITRGTVVAVRSSGSSRERTRTSLSRNITRGSGISTGGRRKLVVVATSGNRGAARLNRSEATTGDNLGEGLRTRDNSGEGSARDDLGHGLRARDNSSEASTGNDLSEGLRARDNGGEARSTGNDLGNTLGSRNDGSETLRAREERGEATLRVRDDSGETLGTSDDGSEALGARQDGSETLGAGNSDSLARTEDSSDVAALGDGLVGNLTAGANRDLASRGSDRRRARLGSINRRATLGSRVGGVGNLSSGGGDRERTRASDIARTLGRSRVSGVRDLDGDGSVRDNNGARELDRLGNTSGDSDRGVRASSSSSDQTGSRDGRASNEATLLEVTDEATASTTGLLGEGGLDTLGKADRQVGDEVEETTREVPLLVNRETEVAVERASDVDTSRDTSTATNLGRVVEKREPNTGTEANIGTSLARETKDGDLETTRDSKLRTESETDLEINTSTKLDISTNANGESLGDETLEGSVDNLLGEKINVDVGICRELDVDTSREINGLTTADDEIKGDGSLDGSLQISRGLEARDSNTKLGGSEEFDGLMDGSRSRKIDLDVSRDATEADTNVGGLEEVGTASETDVTSDLAAGEVKTEIDSGSGLSLGGADTLEEDVILPSVTDAARSSSVPVSTTTSRPLDATTKEALETAEATKSESNTSADTSTKASADTSTNTETASKVAANTGASSNLAAGATLDITFEMASKTSTSTDSSASTSLEAALGTTTDIDTSASINTSTSAK
ncbi:unnamed protein product, partial [Fusarium graminearum]